MYQQMGRGGGPLHVAKVAPIIARNVPPVAYGLPMSEDLLASLPGGDLALAYLSRFSGRTASSYANGLRWFLEWCEKRDLDPAAIRAIHFDLLRREMMQIWMPRTAKLRQTTIRGFYRYLVERGEVDAYPIPAGWSVPLDAGTYAAGPVLSEGQLSKLKRTALADPSPKAALIVVLITDLWMRTSELCEASVEDFVLESNGAVVVEGPAWGAMYRSKTLKGPEAAKIREYIGDRRSGRLFSTASGGDLNRSAIQRILNRLCKQAAVPRVTTNQLRKSALAYSVGGFKGELRPSRLRSIESDSAGERTGSVNAVSFSKELLSLSDALLDEDSESRPVAPVVLSGTAVEHFLRRLALVAGSTSLGGGIEAWAGALRALGVISKQEKKLIAVWAGFRDIAVHDDDKSSLTFEDARSLNVQFTEFVERHQHRFLDTGESQ
jgi:integrase/recombinase XerD